MAAHPTLSKLLAAAWFSVAPATMAESVAELAARVRPALVTVSQEGRDGNIVGSGSGFFVSADGVIATCLHVIGEARRIHVTGSDGTEYPLATVYATDRKADLALLRTTIPPLAHLELAPPGSLAQGDRVLAMGNPQGLDFSVTEGVLSALREPVLAASYGRMLQLAIPIEQGNSGGPLLDMQGRVQGVLSVKSLVTPNLGFASPTESILPLLHAPNVVPYRNWLTIGVLDPQRWETTDGDWRQRSGRVLATAPGAGFGGRTLCIAKETPANEIAVSVQLEDESGAAGLAFCIGENGHYYGFYPSNGRLRLTRFEGESVYRWTILDEVDSPAYRTGGWNELHVEFSPDRIRCSVNGQLAIDSPDTTLRGGRAGLVKFREPSASFRQFRSGSGIMSPTLDASTESQLRAALDAVPPGEVPTGETARSLAAVPPSDARRLLEARAAKLESAAATLRAFGTRTHAATVTEAVVAAARNEPPDAALAALHLSRLENPELETEPYLEELGRLGTQLREEPTVARLNHLLFEENGFHGSRSDFSNPTNCFLDAVLDDREGIPVSLALLMCEVSRRGTLPGLAPLILPGVVLVTDGGTPRRFFEPFERGRELTAREAQETADSYAAPYPAPDVNSHPTATAAEMVSRLAENLKARAIEREDLATALLYANTVHALEPESVQATLSRAILRLQNGDARGAAADFEWILERQPEGVDLRNIRSTLRRINASAPAPPVK